MNTFDIIRPGALARPPAEAVQLSRAQGERTASFHRYVFSDALATAVNVAIHLNRPILVTGEPGTGKTALAWGIAAQLGVERVLEFHARSTSVARDLLYTVDTLRRFYDANVRAARAEDPAAYVHYQALGEAIRADRTQVVLIDEVDKAPRDFPNDLLNELDRMSFSVPEIGPDVRFTARVNHVVVITSNSERQLPPAFLRRCVYHHIEFPDGERLAEIVRLHTADLSPPSGFVAQVVRRFVQLRAVEGLEKAPSTDELIAWTRVLLAMGVDPARIGDGVDLGALPALQALVKVSDDLRLVRGA